MYIGFTKLTRTQRRACVKWYTENPKRCNSGASKYVYEIITGGDTCTYSYLI